MSFLDNLENNLKALESRDESLGSDTRRRDSDRSKAQLVAPWADRLKNSEFAKALMQRATRAGFELRTKVQITWIGGSLRLDARNQRLELQPTPEGVLASMSRDAREIELRRVDLDSDPDPLLRDWMAHVAERKRLDDEAAAAAASEMED